MSRVPGEAIRPLDPHPSKLDRTIPISAPFDCPQPEMFKIGTTAGRLGISIQAIRLYESEGVLVPFRSAGGTRWYSEGDVEWIAKIKELISHGLNFEGIRWLLAQIPCWSLRPCAPELHAACAMRSESCLPCWVAPEKLCSEELKECYHCSSYRSARDFVHLKVYADIVPLDIQT